MMKIAIKDLKRLLREESEEQSSSNRTAPVKTPREIRKELIDIKSSVRRLLYHTHENVMYGLGAELGRIDEILNEIIDHDEFRRIKEG